MALFYGVLFYLWPAPNFVLCTGHLSSISCKWIEYTSNLTLHGFRYYFVRFILYDLRRWPGKFVCHKIPPYNLRHPLCGTGISIWLIAVILSSAVLILALYLLERHYRRVGEKYDSALSQYKTREEAIPAE